jgi:hypothetical protein
MRARRKVYEARTGEVINSYNVLVGKLTDRDNRGDLRVDVTIILKFCLKNWNLWM